MSKKTGLTKHQMELIVTIASEEVVKHFEKQKAAQRKKENDWRLRNTKLLLENYHRLKKHCEEIQEQLTEYNESNLDLEELTLESLMKYKIKTSRMLNHFERILRHYSEECKNGSPEEVRRYIIIHQRYFSEKKFSVQELCEHFCVEQGTIYRDTKIAIKELSVLLFGISALEFTD